MSDKAIMTNSRLLTVKQLLVVDEKKIGTFKMEPIVTGVTINTTLVSASTGFARNTYRQYRHNVDMTTDTGNC